MRLQYWKIVQTLYIRALVYKSLKKGGWSNNSLEFRVNLWWGGKLQELTIGKRATMALKTVLKGLTKVKSSMI